jgi:hypothetical protein
MRRLPRGTNTTVFLLFFGLALIESAQEGHWLWVLFWLAIGAFFLTADRMQRYLRH